MSLTILHKLKLKIESLVILDSSFNPPTRAHLAMLATNLPKLMLIATSNVDKKVSGIDQRLSLMDAVRGDCMVGITTHARFVDKASALQLEFPNTRLLFLMGKDTLSRFFDLKYYKNESELDDFFKNDNRIIWTPRKGYEYEPPQLFKQYLTKMESGVSEGISSTKARILLAKFWKLAPEDHDQRHDILKCLNEILPEEVLKKILEMGLYKDVQ